MPDYLISINDGQMLGLGCGLEPAAAVDGYYDGLDMYCSPSDEISERFSVSTLQLPDNAVEAADDLIDEHGEGALPMIKELVVASGAAVSWQIVDVVMEGGGRTTKLRG